VFRVASYERRSEDRAASAELRGIHNGRSVHGTRYSVLLLLLVLSTSAGHARTHNSAHHGESWARDHFATAERMREALNGRPQADRTRRDFQRVINAYRNVYFGAPTSTKADPSVVAVAETMVEMGRRFDDNKILNGAIAQYRFLRKEYPGSKYRCDALFTIGEIYKDDLNDPEQARAVFQEFLHRYPHNRLVEDAQQAIAELDREAAAETKDAGKKAEAQQKKGGKAATETAAGTSAKKVTAESAAKNTDSKNSDSKTAVAKTEETKPADSQADSAVQASSSDARERRSSRLPRVTGIRHWSTPDYTRVAIDLESNVKFFSQRIDNPDRIFFDLRDTKLASTLVGKSFDVDDGFLKKVRVAQFQPGRTRVVLEVDDLSDYDAFLLPDPYRLIIDIHGKDAKAARAKLPKDAATADVEAEPKAGSGSDAAGTSKDAPGAEIAQNGDDSNADSAATESAATKTSQAKVTSAAEAVASDSARPVRKKNSRRHGSVRTVVDPKTGVKKVIVDAEDDDDSAPVQVAKAEPVNSNPTPAMLPPHNDDGGKEATFAADSQNAISSDAKGGRAKGNFAPRFVSSSKSSDKAADLDVHEAKPTAGGDRSLIRALGLKIGKIVIDPGHGGHDTGTIGPNGLEEKDLVLDVGRKLGKLLETRLGAEVVYTRKDDTFIPLETRTAIANQQRADLFISIHANSSHDPAARGVETYYLNFTSFPEALEVAARENAVSEKSVYELQDLVKKIALKEKIEESREFAGDVQQSLHSGLASKNPGIRNRGVKKAPFIVLIGANMPSILAEISFVSNPGDEHRLETAEYRQRIAESLYRGIAKYANGLSGVKVASNKEKASAQ